jgi:uncharacterized protein YgbK (DUF1537 family)
VNTSSATISKASTFTALPPVWPEDLQARVQAAVQAADRTLVVVDDDPTGTQTVHDVPVVTRWNVETLRAELRRASPCFFVLTNSRSLPSAAARELSLDLARNLRTASALARRDVTLVSRSDSTLRGHFPAETDALSDVWGPFDATILAPYFEAGGRYTLDNIHYVAEGDMLVPAGETPFARDAAFGYRHSELREWVEEKSAGRILAREVQSLSLDLLRRDGPEAVLAALLDLPQGCICVANLCAPRDAEVLAAATLAAERAGKNYLYRTGASFVSARLGLAPRPLLTTGDLSNASNGGGLVVVGSHVPKTTVQLERLLASEHAPRRVELDVVSLLDPARREDLLDAAAVTISVALAAGEDVVVFTSRSLIEGVDASASLDMGRRVSGALVALMRGLKATPRFVIAKGGITSSDIATRGFGVVRAIVRGQILPGVPVWQLGAESRFPGLSYVVFPGNVGDEDSLATAFIKLSRTRTPSPT